MRIREEATYPPRPKRPLKPKVHWQEPGGGIGGLSVLEEGEGVDGDGDEEDLVDSMRALDIEHFAQVSAPAKNTPVLLCYGFSL